MYTAFLSYPLSAGQTVTATAEADTDHEAVMQAYNKLKGAAAPCPWDAKVVVYNGDNLAYTCKTFTAYQVSTN